MILTPPTLNMLLGLVTDHSIQLCRKYVGGVRIIKSYIVNHFFENPLTVGTIYIITTTTGTFTTNTTLQRTSQKLGNYAFAIHGIDFSAAMAPKYQGHLHVL